MKTITIHAPWAWAIMQGHKRWENRTWAANYRGWLAIHAGTGKASDEAAEERFDSVGIDYPDDWTPYRGKLLGVVWMNGCERGAAEGDPFGPGPVRFALSEPRPLAEPIPMIGKQGLTTLSDDMVAAVEAQLGVLPVVEEPSREAMLF